MVPLVSDYTEYNKIHVHVISLIRYFTECKHNNRHDRQIFLALICRDAGCQGNSWTWNIFLYRWKWHSISWEGGGMGWKQQMLVKYFSLKFKDTEFVRPSFKISLFFGNQSRQNSHGIYSSTSLHVSKVFFQAYSEDILVWLIKEFFLWSHGTVECNQCNFVS